MFRNLEIGKISKSNNKLKLKTSNINQYQDQTKPTLKMARNEEKKQNVKPYLEVNIENQIAHQTVIHKSGSLLLWLGYEMKRIELN